MATWPSRGRRAGPRLTPGGAHSGAAAEERALTELGAAGITLAILGDVRRARTRGVEPGYHAAVLSQHLAVHGSGESADGEARIHRVAERQIESAPRSFVLWRKEFLLLVKVRILAAGGVLVVPVQRGDQISLRDAKGRFHFLDCFPAVDQGHQGHLGTLQVLL